MRRVWFPFSLLSSFHKHRQVRLHFHMLSISPPETTDTFPRELLWTSWLRKPRSICNSARSRLVWHNSNFCPVYLSRDNVTGTWNWPRPSVEISHPWSFTSIFFLQIVANRVVTPYGLVGRYRWFGGTCYLHFQGSSSWRWRQHGPK
jgi:hypothetical protein